MQIHPLYAEIVKRSVPSSVGGYTTSSGRLETTTPPGSSTTTPSSGLTNNTTAASGTDSRPQREHRPPARCSITCEDTRFWGGNNVTCIKY